MGETSGRRFNGRVPAAEAVAALVAGVLVAGALVAAVDDVGVQQGLHRTESREATTQALLQRTTSQLVSTRRSTEKTDEGGAVAGRGLTHVNTEANAARRQLTQAQQGMASGAVELGAVHSCAGGVSRSVSALQKGDQKLAVSALSSVAAVCENMLGPGPGGPVYPFDFADPDVVEAKGVYYAYGTNSTAGNIQIMESTDLVTWRKAGDALPTLASWAAPGDTWAPAVIKLKRSYVLYYTAATAGGRVQCLSVATARKPEGPFTDRSTAPLECQPELGGSIDPSPYLDAKDHPYLAWKSNGAGGQPATVWAEALDPQGTALAGPGPTQVLQPSQTWEGSVVEAPSMIDVGGTYFLFYSGNNWDSADYAIGVARCAGVLGPCGKPLAGPLFGSQTNLEGPGGETVFTDGQGQLEMAFSAWLPGAVGYPHPRLLFTRPLEVTNGIPGVEQPSG